MAKCPLRNEDLMNLTQGLACLRPKCRQARCPYVDSGHDSAHLPMGCILLVVAILDPSRGGGAR